MSALPVTVEGLHTLLGRLEESSVEPVAVRASLRPMLTDPSCGLCMASREDAEAAIRAITTDRSLAVPWPGLYSAGVTIYSYDQSYWCVTYPRRGDW